MARFELLVGAARFWARAAADLEGARRRALIQAMTFEGDAAGAAAAAALAGSPAPDRRLLVDAYSLHVINDRALGSVAGRRDEALQAEARATWALFDRLVEGGAGVRITNPAGPLRLFWPARNHKKMLIVDDVAYVGGINFSDHNFAWPDLMVRIEDPAAADFLSADFAATWTGAARRASGEFGPLALHVLDGRSNAEGFAAILDLIAAARREIVVVSPYVTFPFVNALARAAGRDVAVRLVTPQGSNKPTVRDYLLGAADRGGLDVRLTAEMIHLKGLLVDGEALVVGSSNFDFVSHAAEEEIVAVIRDPALIADFAREVLDPALATAQPMAQPPSAMRAAIARAALGLAHPIARAARHAPRTAIDWRAIRRPG